MRKALSVPLILLLATSVAAALVAVQHPEIFNVSEDSKTEPIELLSQNPLPAGHSAAPDQHPAAVASLGSTSDLAGLLQAAPGRGDGVGAEYRERTTALLKEAARTGSKALLDEIGALPKNCPGCGELFRTIQELFKDSSLSSDEQIYLASALAASGTASNQAFLYDQFRRASADPSSAPIPAATIARQLERNQQGGPLAGEVVDQITNDLQSDNPYLREAAISLLTRQRSREAAERLYEYTVNNADRDGFYRQGMGLGLMTPEPEAFPFLEDLVRKQDQYSHLALKALLNGGADGVGAAMSLLAEIPGSVANRALIMGAVDHIPMYGPTLKYIESLTSSPNPTIKELARDVVREYQSRQAALKKGIEYNENYASGIILPTPGPY
jgi:hypothetical protein